MFGRGSRISTLETRADEQDTTLARVTHAFAATEQRILDLQASVAQDPEQRLAIAIHGVSERLAGELESALAALAALRRAVAEVETLRARMEASSRSEGELEPRVIGRLGQIYRAEWTGYVSLYFEGGYTDIVELRVGSESPPAMVACTLNSRNGINTYAGAVVRRGEYWLAASSRTDDSSGVRCVFTPFA